MSIDSEQAMQLEAAAFRRLVAHLQANTEVQNIDLMILADFCRNCMSKWLVAAAEEHNIPLDYEAARTHVYGMPYEAWKDAHQLPASPEKLEQLRNRGAGKTTR